MKTSKTQESSDFWRTIPLEELAGQQGVSTACDLDQISALWPADDDPDELLNHVLLERTERRAPRSSGKGRNAKHGS